jgi:hypothetical protein
MEQRDGEVTCLAGDMGLSIVMLEELSEIVAADPTLSEPSPLRWGGKWHCPADGSLMREQDGRVGCAECGRYLPSRVLYQLIEFHPHGRREEPSRT